MPIEVHFKAIVLTLQGCCNDFEDEMLARNSEVFSRSCLLPLNESAVANLYRSRWATMHPEKIS